MKIIEIIDASELGGGQFHLAGLLQYIDTSAFEVSVCASRESPFGQYIANLDLNQLPIDVQSFLGPTAFIRLVRKLRRGRADVLHLHGGVAGMWGRLAAIFAGTPTVIYTCHGLHFLHKANPFVRWVIKHIEWFLSRKNDGIIYVSDHDMRVGIASGVMAAKVVKVIRNGIEPARYRGSFDPERKKRELGLPLDSPIFGCVGRLHRQKGHAVLLNAMRELVVAHPGVRLLLIGDGPLRGELEEKVLDWGLKDQVIFCGFREDIPDLLRLMDLFILPSHWEGFPISLLEAMAAGTPVIASKIGGVTEIVEEDKTGHLFSMGQHEELASLMGAFFESKKDFRAMADLARERVLSDYTLERMANQTMEFIREVHNGIHQPRVS